MGHLERLLVSNGICFKTHLTNFGGSGYNGLFTKVLNTFDPSIVDQLLIHNPKRLLLWREEVQEEVKKVVLTWACAWCMVMHEEAH